MNASGFIGGLFVGFVVGLLPLYAFCYLLYVLVGLPLRRQERARLFLDLAETGLTQGRTIEETIVSASKSEDTSLGVRFHLVAAHVESGWGLIPALQLVGGVVPPQVLAMLRAGAELGDPKRVLPACRTVLKDGASHVQSAYNYLVVLAFVVLPIIPALFWMMTVFIIPKYEAMFQDLLEGEALPSLPFHFAALLSQVQILLALCVYVGMILYIGGPRLIAWMGAGLFMPQLDTVATWVPWRRKRMRRDFGAMLGVLLDASIPEERAVQLAAEGTANTAFRLPRGAGHQLRHGIALPDALATFDATGELRWRLTNAFRSGHGFLSGLQGWLDSLDARAFRQQQTFAQTITTALVLYNGTMVALFACFVFEAITRVIEMGVLW
ncbi:MAG: hypothetical protein U1G07_00870 [Verrucomicrobiota bacterium]